MDPRHRLRVKTIQNLYANYFIPKNNNLPFPTDKIFVSIAKSRKKIDKIIETHAQKFTIDKIAKIDLAILQLAVYELVMEKKHPQKVIINEAVELAKELGGDKSFSFINGVLGNIVKTL